MYIDHANPTRLPANGRLSKGITEKLSSENNGQTFHPARMSGQKSCYQQSVAFPSHLEPSMRNILFVLQP